MMDIAKSLYQASKSVPKLECDRSSLLCSMREKLSGGLQGPGLEADLALNNTPNREPTSLLLAVRTARMKFLGNQIVLQPFEEGALILKNIFCNKHIFLIQNSGSFSLVGTLLQIFRNRSALEKVQGRPVRAQLPSNVRIHKCSLVNHICALAPKTCLFLQVKSVDFLPRSFSKRSTSGLYAESFAS